MGNLTTALAIVLSVTAMLILGGMVMSDLAGEDKTIMSCYGTMFQDGCKGNNTYILNASIDGKLPSTNLNPVNPTGITGEEGIWASIGSWIADKTGISYVYNIVSMPSTILKIAFGGGAKASMYADVIATIWYILCLFLIISWWKGQDNS